MYNIHHMRKYVTALKHFYSKYQPTNIDLLLKAKHQRYSKISTEFSKDISHFVSFK